MLTMTTNITARSQKQAARKSWYAQLWVWVFAGMVIGIALGKFDPNLGMQMQPLGDAFIKLIRMLIAPIIFCTVVHGIRAHGRHGARWARGAEGDHIF
jgi:aerobic C4-dicarboxylate transport protein